MDDLMIRLRMRALQILNILLVTAAFALSWKTAYVPFFARGAGKVAFWGGVIGYAALYVVFTQVYDAFLVSQQRISEIVYSQMLSALFADGIFYLFIVIRKLYFPSPLPMLGALAAQLVCILLWAIFAHQWYFLHFPPKRTAVIYDGGRAFETLIREYGLEKKFDIRIVLRADECVRDLSQLDGLETVFLADLHSYDRNAILKYCIDHDVMTYVLPVLGDVIMSGAKRVHMFHLPMLRVERCSPSPEYVVLKRAFDLLFSVLALLVLSPVMLLTALAVKLTDGGPVFYCQTRLTRGGKLFSLLKFRSMRVDAESDGVARLSAGEQDPRITPVGRVIRKLRIDELPQLLNILQGSMSIVGPRPERPEIAALYERELPEFRLRLQVKAGLTGYAQVYGKYNSTPKDKLKMDLMYIARPSLIEDLRICFATVKILFLPESTEGVETGQTTALHTEARETVAAGDRRE